MFTDEGREGANHKTKGEALAHGRPQGLGAKFSSSENPVIQTPHPSLSTMLQGLAEPCQEGASFPDGQ